MIVEPTFGMLIVFNLPDPFLFTPTRARACVCVCGRCFSSSTFQTLARVLLLFKKDQS